MHMFIAIYFFLGVTFIHTQNTTIFTYVYVSMGTFHFGRLEGEMLCVGVGHMFKMLNRLSIMFMKGTMKVVDHVIELLVCQKIIQMPSYLWNFRCQMQDIE